MYEPIDKVLSPMARNEHTQWCHELARRCYFDISLSQLAQAFETLDEAALLQLDDFILKAVKPQRLDVADEIPSDSERSRRGLGPR